MIRSSASPVRRSFATALFAIAAALPASGCFGPLAKKLADREVYPIVEQKRIEALGEARDFTIESVPDPLTERVLAEAGKANDEFTTAGMRLTLAETLSLAAANNRSYRNRRESLYLAALALTSARHEFSPIFTGFVTGDYSERPVVEGDAVVDATRSASLDTNIRVSKLIAATGGRVTIGLANSFLRFAGGDPARSATGAASISVVQPLLRGAGMRVAVEGLKQSERNMIYEVRDFARFEKDFVIERISEYFRLLQRLDQVANERRSYESLIYGRERSEAFAEAGKLDIFQLEQARQQELTARNRWLNAQTDFVRQLDEMKINLGLPTDIAIFPDETELDELQAAGLAPLEVGLDEAVEIALRDRLDYKTSANLLEDAERRILVAENALLPTLDASASVSFFDDDSDQPLSFDWRRRNLSAGADLELPLDRKDERNDYRRALIARERAKRDFELARDSILQEVRSAYQTLEQAAQTHEIQRQSLAVAERRAEAAPLLLEAKRNTVRDVLESEEDLLDAKNAQTRALVDYHLARLNFLLAIEALEVDDGGAWRDTTEENRVADVAP